MLALTAIFLAALVGAQCAPLEEAGLTADDVGQVISNMNAYLEQHHQDSTDLPNIGILPIDPVKLRNGHFGKLSSFELHGQPEVYHITNTDGSDTYSYDLTLGLKELSFDYDFSINVLGLYKKEGNVTISPQQNELQVSGIVVIQPDKTCDAMLYGAKYTKYQDFKINIQPNDFPQIAQVSKVILDFFAPEILPLSNGVLGGMLLFPNFQKDFSQIVCNSLAK